MACLLQSSGVVSALNRCQPLRTRVLASGSSRPTDGMQLSRFRFMHITEGWVFIQLQAIRRGCRLTYTAVGRYGIFLVMFLLLGDPLTNSGCCETPYNRASLFIGRGWWKMTIQF